MRFTKVKNKTFWTNPVNDEVVLEPTREEKLKFDYWHSKLEFDVYKELHRTFPKAIIARQIDILVMPSNKFFKPIRWIIDFKLSFSAGTLPVYIEVKGEWIYGHSSMHKEFASKLQILSWHHPYIFQQLIVVSDKEWEIPGTKIKTINYKKIKDVQRDILIMAKIDKALSTR